MIDQMGTPGSTADTSINGGSKVGSAPKDKACPFCQQQFTSSSLGRHLDLYIKEKNPKPADGIHNVDEIRKMRGGITRRQPRNSTSRREGSTPAGTPGAHDRRGPRPESVRDDRSPSARRDDIGSSNLMYSGKPRIFINKASWEATGVMNSIPAARNSDSKSWDGEDRDGRRLDGRSRSVSKQVLAKTTFDQKQKMLDALDNAKAAELALRELLGSFRAAKERAEGPEIFDYDPLTFDFPGLCLHCLPPPPTLHTSIPIPTPQSWTISPPEDAQYNALRAHFSSIFQSHRNALAIATTAPQDDLSYPPLPDSFIEDPTSQTAQAEAAASELESKISSHLHDIFAAWTSLSPQKRCEIWTLELARTIGRKSAEIDKLKKDKDFSQQTNAHLRLQNNELSRLQQPREFRMVPPQTVPLGQEMMNELSKLGANVEIDFKSVGFTLKDRNVHLDTLIERAIGRWKGVVREARGGSQAGMAAQRSLSGESLLSPEIGTHLTVNTNSSINLSPNLATNTNSNHNTPDIQPAINGVDSIGSDQDADADADMEEEDSYGEIPNLNNGQRAPEAPMAQSNQGFRLANGNVAGQKSGGSSGMEGIETIQGYVRIGA